jgi:hypothetical protein
MTLCISAACTDKNKPCIIVSSDWQTEIGDFAGAEIQRKLFWIHGDSWPVLTAGTASKGTALIATYRQLFKTHGLNRANILSRLQDPALRHKERLTDDYVRARLGVSFEHFRTNKEEIDPALWTNIWTDIRKLHLDCSLIIAGFVNGDQFMFQVDPDTEVWRDDNFLAIGTGATLATSILCYRRQHEDRSLAETLYNVYEATRFAYKAKAPGVGRIHAFSVLSLGKKGKTIARGVKSTGVKILEGQYKRIWKARLPANFKIPADVLREY